MREIISGRMSDRVLLCIGRLSNSLPSKKSSWRAVVVEEIISRSGLDKLIKVAGVYLNRRENISGGG